MPLNLVLLALYRLTGHFYKLGRHVSGEALRVISVDGQGVSSENTTICIHTHVHAYDKKLSSRSNYYC